MARRSDHTREELAALFVDAARLIIAAQGVRGLTARKVAERVGYAPGSLYNVIGNIDDLILRVNAETLDRLAERMSAVAMTGEPEADLAALLDVYLKFENENAVLWGALVEHVLPEAAALPEWYSTKIETLLAIVAQAIAPLLKDSEVLSARLAVKLLWASLHGITSLGRSGKLLLDEGETSELMARNLVETFLAGLKARR